MNTHCSSSISERILSFADMWDIDHPGPPAMHKIILVHLPCTKLVGRRNHHDLVNSASSRKLTVPAILLPHAKTGRHCTTSYHWTTLGQTSPPRSSILERREYVSSLLWFCVVRLCTFAMIFLPYEPNEAWMYPCQLLSDRSLSLQF